MYPSALSGTSCSRGGVSTLSRRVALIALVALLLAPALVMAQSPVELPSVANITVTTGCTDVMLINATYDTVLPVQIASVEYTVTVNGSLFTTLTDFGGASTFNASVVGVPATGYNYTVIARLNDDGIITVIGNVSGVQLACNNSTNNTTIPVNTPAPPAPNAVVPVAPVGDDLSAGAIVGIVIGSVAGVALIALAIWFLCRGGGGAGGPGLVAVSAPVAPAAAARVAPLAAQTTEPYV